MQARWPGEPLRLRYESGKGQTWFPTGAQGATNNSKTAQHHRPRGGFRHRTGPDRVRQIIECGAVIAGSRTHDDRREGSIRDKAEKAAR